MSRKTKIWIAVSAALGMFTLVMVGVVAVSWGGHDDAVTAGSTTSSATRTAAAAVPGVTGFGTPTTDFVGRRVMIPNNPAGQPLEQKDPADLGGCDPTRPVVPPAGVMIQRTFDIVNLFSTSDGPARLEGDRAVGYRQSPQGAALAAWNIFKRMGVGGAVSEDVLLNQVVLTDRQRNDLEAGGPLGGPGIDPAALKHDLAAEAFRILGCDRDFVSIEYAAIQPGDGKGLFPQRRWLGYRMAAMLRDGDWKFLPDAAGLAPAPYTALGEEWTRWAL